jgi:hypothetical protein
MVDGWMDVSVALDMQIDGLTKWEMAGNKE